MRTIRRAGERGLTRTGWLESRHSFSFAQYYDERHVHFGPLRVLNDDIVQGGGGFPRHPHQEMEILTYVIHGALEHRDSTGGHGVIRPGDVQRMTAGTGITHSEFNHSDSEELRFLQVWIIPAEQGLAPGYEQKSFDADARANRLLPVAMPAPVNGALTVHQDVRMFISHMDDAVALQHSIDEGRGGYLFVVDGKIRVDADEIGRGDAVMVTDAHILEFAAVEESEIVLFDVPMQNY